MEMFKTYDYRSGAYRGTPDQSSVHGWGVEVCCPAFLCEKQWQYQALDDNARIHLTRISKNNVVRIDWSVRSSDMSKILTCLWQSWTEGPTHNNGINKPQTYRCSLAWDIVVDPSAPNHQYLEYAKPVIVLICHWLGTHSLLIKALSSSKCNV